VVPPWTLGFCGAAKQSIVVNKPKLFEKSKEDVTQNVEEVHLDSIHKVK